uniref:Uncharacterized protein n=1 Tax=Arundo donax TaxID=35708 RepID=A0A0A9ECW5_ARUDO
MMVLTPTACLVSCCHYV